MKLAFQLLAVFMALSSSFAHPVHTGFKHHRIPREVTIIGRSQSSKRYVGIRQATNGTAPELQLLADGNNAFREQLNKDNPALFRTLTADGQAPPFMFIGCSDSRASEGTIFNAKPGTLFTERNIANQFLSTDTNTHAVLSYAVAVLGVKHVIVMGHYGCGGVAAAIASPPAASVDAANGLVQAWIDPIRELFRTSFRPEIVKLREEIKGQAAVEEPNIREPGFRALVEENVKASVRRIATDSVIANHYTALSSSSFPDSTNSSAKRSGGEPTSPVDVFIHGWVYDIENGEIRDLNVSVGPPGKTIPAAPFPVVANAAADIQSPTGKQMSESLAASLNSTAGGGGNANMRARCEQSCKAKRFFFSRPNAI